MARNNNQIIVPQARQALDKMKVETAAELGIANYDQIDKGNLTARQNGYVGGNITRKLVKMAQDSMSGQQF